MKLRKTADGKVAFKCLGCDEMHAVPVGVGGWGFNNDFEKPTLTPSILVRSGHYAEGVSAQNGTCWCTFTERTGQESSFKCVCCHSFVTDGRIQYLGDCSHALAGQTIELPDVGE